MGPRSLAKAVGFGVALAVVVVATAIAGGGAFFVLAFVVVMLAQAELYAVLRSSGHTPAVLLGLVSGAAVLIGAYSIGPNAIGFTTAFSLLLICIWCLTVAPDKVASTVAATFLGVVYGPVMVSFALSLLRTSDGVVLVAGFIGMTAVFDSAAYLFGRKIGRRRLAPKTSPKKSWEGFAAGCVVTVAVSVAILSFLHPFTPASAAIVALLMCVTGPLGDLGESLVKRDLGVKDMGTLLPGHGGLFDRIDAIIFSAPFAFLAYSILGLT